MGKRPDDDAERLVGHDSSSGDESPRATPKGKKKTWKPNLKIIVVVAVVVSCGLAWLLLLRPNDRKGASDELPVDVKQPATTGTDFAAPDGQAFVLDTHTGVEYPAVVQDIYEDGYSPNDAAIAALKYVPISHIPGCPLPQSLVERPQVATGSEVVSLQKNPNVVVISSQIVPGAKKLPSELCGRTLALWPTENFLAKRVFTIIGGCIPHENPMADGTRQPHCVTDQKNVLRIPAEMRQQLATAAMEGGTPLQTSTSKFGDPNDVEVDPADPTKHKKFQYKGLSFAVY